MFYSVQYLGGSPSHTYLHNVRDAPARVRFVLRGVLGHARQENFEIRLPEIKYLSHMLSSCVNKIITNVILNSHRKKSMSTRSATLGGEKASKV